MREQNNHVTRKGTSIREKKMRYFIFYPPTKSITLVDVGENVRVNDIIELIKEKFDLKIHDSSQSEATMVLSYNGFDLKPNWCFADLSIPSGTIIHFIHREVKAADLYVYCGFNEKTLKLFNSSITMETHISTLRKQISNELGLPLSTFCLETSDGTQRLYDEMKLINYDIKTHDHVYLKVWRGYEKLIRSSVKGLTARYSTDELTGHYQAQVALHIAAFYGHLELAKSAIRQGARSDRPVGEHPSRQWSSETNINIFPEILKCPIHIAIERGHNVLVNYFVEQSVLCTQTRHPVTGALPYRLALSYWASANAEEKKRSVRSSLKEVSSKIVSHLGRPRKSEGDGKIQCYKLIYLYLYNKQYYSKIPLNANGEYISNLLTSASNTNAVHRPSPHHVNVSLPFYCRIIRWCDRAREKVWKRFGGQCSTIIQTKRVYPEKGLLGYKVLIDGYNNTFEVPPEPPRYVRSGGTLRTDRYIGFNDEEREKLIQTEAFMKQFTMDDGQRAKQTALTHLQQSYRSLASKNLHKNSIIKTQDSEDLKKFKPKVDIDNSSAPSLLPSSLTSAIQREGRGRSDTLQSAALIPAVNEKNVKPLPVVASLTSHAPTTLSTLTNQLETVVNNNNQQPIHPVMSSANAYLLSSALRSLEIEQHRAAKRRELFTDIEQSVQQLQQRQQLEQHPEKSSTLSSDPSSNRVLAKRSALIDVDSRLLLPDHPINLGSGAIKSRQDLEVRQSAFKSYERYASASTRSTALNCLQEASHFKRKPWIKQVQISQEMVKHKVERRISRADQINRNSTLSPLRASSIKTLYKSNSVKAN